VKTTVLHPELDPTLIYLHGRGESGIDGENLRHGLFLAIERHPERWPFRVIAFQKPEMDVLWPAHLDEINAALAEIPHREGQRVVLTGLSQGGHGTMALCQRLNWPVHAIAPICGWAEDPVATAEAIRGLDAWFFHGLADDVVPPTGSTDVSSLLPDARVTLYEEVGHNSWDLAYGDPELANWLLGSPKE
jgi:predicted peptidase